jgi:NTE family protein
MFEPAARRRPDRGFVQKARNLLERTFRRRPRRARSGRKTINLALQGGGAHGAFTWGVLDHLLEDGRLQIEGISGTSAGAVNAIVLADGLAKGGPEAARAQLAEFWRAASSNGRLTDLQRRVVERLFSGLPFENWPVKLWLNAMGRYLSPYDLNPLNINPLKELIERFVDFEAVRRCDRLQLFISATNVHSGQLRVFPREQVSAEVVMASASLPFLFHAVEIDGEAYWDGGYLGNPVLFPFLRATETEDVLVVQINPLHRRQVPTSAREIMSRVSEITFNSSLMNELRAIAFVGRMIDQGNLPRGTGPGEYRRINLHRVALDGAGTFDGRSALKTDFEFFTHLMEAGRAAARAFLAAHYDDIGTRSTVDVLEEARWCDVHQP